VDRDGAADAAVAIVANSAEAADNAAVTEEVLKKLILHLKRMFAPCTKRVV